MEDKNTKIIEITPLMAQQMLEHNVCNRPLSKALVANYAKEMERGEWGLSHQGIAIGKTGNLLDGQHRLYAVIKAGVALMTRITYDVDDELFDKMDVGKARTAGDVLSVNGVKNANKVASAIAMRQSLLGNIGVRSFQGHAKMTKHDYCCIYNANEEKWNHWTKFGARMYSSKKDIVVAYISGISFFLDVDMHYPKERIEQFFEELCGVKLATSMATVKLANFFANQKGAREKATEETKKAYIAQAWKAFISGKDLKRLDAKEIEF